MIENTLRALPVVQVRGLTKVYGAGEEKFVALRELNLTIKRGELCCVFGMPGSGKSVLFNQLAGMEEPTWGQILIGGVSVSDLNEDGLTLFRQRHMGLIFQDDNLLPELSVIENIAMPLMFRGMAPSARKRAAQEIACRAGLQYSMDCLPEHLSGEMQKRVSIARAFVARPDVILADEPIGNLSLDQKKEILELIKELAQYYRQTVVLLSKDPMINYYGDHLLTLQKGEFISDKKGSSC